MSEELRPVTVLYTMPKSVYLGMPGVDCWDEVRDARNWPGGTPVVAHPPCGPWCRQRYMPGVRWQYRICAPHAVNMVNRWGGVLEHPQYSSLWAGLQLPLPGHGSRLKYTLAVSQRHWGHEAEKATWLYICGVPMEALPNVPLRLGYPTRVLTDRRGKNGERRLRGADRIRTPPAFAKWLVDVARLAQPQE